MSIILSTLRDLARTLGCGDHQVETVVREERSARVALSRRGLFVVAGAVACGTIIGIVPGVRKGRKVTFYVNGEKVGSGWFEPTEDSTRREGSGLEGFGPGGATITVMTVWGSVPAGAACVLGDG